MSAHKGIKKHDQTATVALFKQLKHLDSGAMEGDPVVVPRDPDLFYQDEKKRALEAANLIKEK